MQGRRTLGRWIGDGHGGPADVGTARATAGSGWYRETVFHWEFGWKVPLRQKLHLQMPRSKKFASPGPKAGRGRNRSHRRASVLTAFAFAGRVRRGDKVSL